MKSENPASSNSCTSSAVSSSRRFSSPDCTIPPNTSRRSPFCNSIAFL